MIQGVNPRLKLLFVRSSFMLLAALACSFNHTKAQDSLGYSPAPYTVGEHLTYNVSFSNFVSAAHIEFLVAGRGVFFGRNAIQLKGHIETTGLVNAALFAINNDYITYIDAATGTPFRGQQTIRAASRTTDTSADFNEPAGVSAIPSKRIGEFPGTFDLLSAIYRVRALPLTQGTTYYITVRDGSDAYNVEATISGNEAMKTNIGTFNAIVCRLRIRNNSQFNGYGIKVYFSDDQRHVPVLITAHHPAGDIRAELAASELVAQASVPSAAG